ncbi:DUF4328 domain-containing protein [Williamsia muralis]|uniref:DUF4328 domain-containing protein n=1 Tax=Williamsia marianensis TaxID=85044 RepID=A0ABU4ER35_WILMA|nr:DUF4328 domain-containing protein [Williamsia muralis]MDV7133683.1 DUF4328 domain-containing protein [Williamsia muralis]
MPAPGNVPAPPPPGPQPRPNNMYVPPRSQRHQSVSGGAPRQMSPTARRMVRWVALRPPEARPRPRARIERHETPTPRYRSVPQWGLQDSPATEPETREQNLIEQATTRLPQLLLITAGVLVAAAAAEAWIYALLVVNLEEPVSRGMQVAAEAAVWITGLASVAMMLACLAGAAGWLIEERRRSYGEHGQYDPRTRREIFIGCWVPVINVFRPVAFMREVLELRDDLPRDHIRKRLWWLWAGWVLVNLLVVGCIVLRIFAESLLWQSNAVLLVIVSDLASAGFAVAVWWTITRLLDREAETATPTRWLVAV